MHNNVVGGGNLVCHRATTCTGLYYYRKVPSKRLPPILAVSVVRVVHFEEFVVLHNPVRGWKSNANYGLCFKIV